MVGEDYIELSKRKNKELKIKTYNPKARIRVKKAERIAKSPQKGTS